VASGKTPAGMHLPIMVSEVLECLRLVPGDVAVDCTLGGGGHARAILERICPGGRLIGLDIDPLEQPRTEARLRAAGFGADAFATRQGTFAGLPQVLAAESLSSVNVAFADLGVSSMQIDNPDRGFSYKGAGPLDSREFQTALDEYSIGLSFDASRDTFSGSLRTLSAHRDEAVRLARLALTEPRFDPEPVERMRSQIITGIKASERDPGEIASRAMMEAAGDRRARPRD